MVGSPSTCCEWYEARPNPKAFPKDAHGHDDGDREAKLGNIIAGCIDIAGTPAELYLRNRGITATDWPSSLRFRPNAYGRYGALVALATDAEGEVHALQQIYLTDAGRKAPVQVQKRTNKMHDGWSEWRPSVWLARPHWSWPRV